MAFRRVCQTILIIALIGLVFFATEGEARRRAPTPKKPRVTPILECVTIGTKTYTAYLGYENEDGSPSNATIDSDDNRFVAIGFRWTRSQPWFFKIWNIVPGRPGRSPLYPNPISAVELPLFSIGIWNLCGRILLITQWGPKCTAPDQIAPVFTVPSKCPVTYSVNNLPGTMDGEWTQCFKATDNDKEGGVSWENTFEPSDKDACLTEIDITGPSQTGVVIAKDRSGNAASCTVTVVVVDKEAPKIICPANMERGIVNVNDEVLQLVGNDIGVRAIATDNNAATVISYSWSVTTSKNNKFTGTGAYAIGTYTYGVNTVTYTAKDSAGNSATCQQKVTIVDAAKPKFTRCPDAVTYNQGSSIVAIYAKATDQLTNVKLTVQRTDPNNVVTSGQSITSQACRNEVQLDGSLASNGQRVTFLPGTTQIVFTATDEKNNVETCSTSITIIAKVDKFDFCPTSRTITTNAGFRYGTFLSGPTTIAVAPAGFTVKSQITYPSSTATGLADISVNKYPVGTTSIDFSATNTAGVTIYCAALSITVNDNEAPILACPLPRTIGTDAGKSTATVPVDFYATGIDNNKIAVTITSVPVLGTTTVSTAAVGEVAATQQLPLSAIVSELAIGDYVISWSATDGVQSASACSATISVRDQEDPVVTCPANLVYTVAPGAEYVSVTAAATLVTATDNVGVVGVTINTNAATNVAGDYYGPKLSTGESSAVYTFVATATDAAGRSAPSCTFTITVVGRTYCDSTTCGNGGSCTQTPGGTGVATGYVCDCSATKCYAGLADCKTSDGSFPFPPNPTVVTTTVAACTEAVVKLDDSVCVYASAVAGDLVRSWSLFSISPDSSPANAALVNGIIAAASASNAISFTFGPTDLIGGQTYIVRLTYTHVASGATYIVDQAFAKQVGNSPTVEISGLPYDLKLGEHDVLESFTLTASSQTCNVPTAAPQYSWTTSTNCGLVTNLAYLTVPFSPVPCQGLVIADDNIFTVTVTDANGLTGSAQFKVKITPYSPPPAVCQTTTQAPQVRVMVNRFDPEISEYVDFAQNGATCTADGGCFPQALSGREPNTFDAFDSSDPRSCNPSETPLLYRWEIFFPPGTNAGAKYTSAGMVGYDAPVLKIAIGSLPAFTQATLDKYWRVRLTITSTAPANEAVPNGPLTTVAFFRFQYQNSQLSMAVSTSCQSPMNEGVPCSFAAGAPVPVGTVTENGFAIQDTSSSDGWNYVWTVDPPVDLTGAGADTSVLNVPATLVGGTYYVFTVTATKSAQSATKSMTVYVAANKPSGGSLSVSPSTGTALTQPFVVSTTGWVSGSALTYAYKYIVGEDIVGAVEESLTSLSWKSSAAVYLPAGRITIVAYIYAQDGSFVRKSQTIDVIEQTSDNRACWVLDMVNTLLSQAEEQQDMAKSLQLVGYLADYLKAPELQGVASLVCSGVDQTTAIRGVRARFMTLLEKLSNQPLDNTQADMLTAAMRKVVSNARVTAMTPTEAVTAAAMLSNIINGMTTSGATQGAMGNMQTQVLSLVSQLAGWIEDCTVLDTLAVDMRTMFIAANTKGVAGTTSVYMEGENVEYGSQTVWANVAQQSNLGDDIVFNFPAGALSSSSSDFNINMINYLNGHVRACRANDVSGAAVTVSSTVLSVEVVQARDHSVLSVSNLVTPITFSLPIRSDVEAVPSCGTGAGPLTCAWWDTTNKGWSTAGCQTMSASATLPSGATGVQCACSHLTEFAIIRPTGVCTDQSILRGFRATVAVYILLFAVVFGLFCRTMRQTRFILRENMLFTCLASISCALRIALGSHYAEFVSFPVGVVDVLAVVPYAILYWINGHYFSLVRIQRIESTEARVRWRVEPILRLVLLGVFLGMLTLLAGIGMDAHSQAKMAEVVSRVVAFAYTAANLIFFGYACTIMAGFASGRSDVGMTRAMAVMSFATLMETIFWGVYPTNGYALFPATVCDLIALSVLIYRYRSPMDDKSYMSSRAGHRDASEALNDDNDIDEVLRPSMDSRSSQFIMDSPRRPSTQLHEPPVMEEEQA